MATGNGHVTGHTHYKMHPYSLASCKNETEDPISRVDFVEGQAVMRSDVNDCYGPYELCDWLRRAPRDPKNNGPVSQKRITRVCDVADALGNRMTMFDEAVQTVHTVTLARYMARFSQDHSADAQNLVAVLLDQETKSYDACEALLKVIRKDPGRGFPRFDTARTLFKTIFDNLSLEGVCGRGSGRVVEAVDAAMDVYASDLSVTPQDPIPAEAWRGLELLIFYKHGLKDIAEGSSSEEDEDDEDDENDENDEDDDERDEMRHRRKLAREKMKWKQITRAIAELSKVQALRQHTTYDLVNSFSNHVSGISDNDAADLLDLDRWL